MMHRNAWLLASSLVIALGIQGVGCREEVGANGGSAGTGGGGGSAGSGGGGQGGAGEPLLVAHWNVHNFFDDVDDPTMQNDDPQNNITGEQILSTAEYQQKLGDVGVVLAGLGADVLVFSEIESQQILDDLNADQLAGAYPFRQLVKGNDPRGIHIGILSKVVIDQVVSHKDDMFQHPQTLQNFTFARDAPEFHFTVNGMHVAFVAVHYRSKGPPDDADKRFAEAYHSREIADAILAADPAAGVAVLGDYNDLPGSPPVLAVLGGDFTDLTSLAPAADQWTYFFMGDLELIDHHIASPLLTPLAQSCTIPHGPDIEAASDHSPVLVTYSIP